jgi:hypothetical protein
MDVHHSDAMADNTAIYATDFYAWCLRTANLVRTGQWDAIDPEALAEELESLGKSQKRELESRLITLVTHLLKWEYQPHGRVESHSWLDTIIEQRQELELLIRDNPNLRPQVADFLTEAYPKACTRARTEMRPEPRLPRRGADALRPRGSLQSVMRPSTAFPPACPWSATEVLDPDFWPGRGPTP